jgi:hypothetical protein
MVTAWSGLAEVGPRGSTLGRGRSLSLTVPCLPFDGDESEPLPHDAPSHPLVLHSDWTADIPHDLEAERVAAPFGAPLTCVKILDDLLPSIRDTVQLWNRRVHPADYLSDWADAFSGSSYSNHRARAQDFRNALREPWWHLTDAERRLAWPVLSQLRPPSSLRWRYAKKSLAEPAQVASEEFGIDEIQGILGDAGYCQEAVRAVHSGLSIEGEPLPLRLYLALAEFPHDLVLLAQLRDRGHRLLVDLVEKRAADLPAHQAGEIAELLEAGVRPGDLRDLLVSGRSAMELITAAARFGELDVKTAAAAYASWWAWDLDPSLEQLLAVRACGVTPTVAPRWSQVMRGVEVLGASWLDAALIVVVLARSGEYHQRQMASALAGIDLMDASTPDFEDLLALLATRQVRTFSAAYPLLRPDLEVDPDQPILKEST